MQCCAFTRSGSPRRWQRCQGAGMCQISRREVKNAIKFAKSDSLLEEELSFEPLAHQNKYMLCDDSLFRPQGGL